MGCPASSIASQPSILWVIEFQGCRASLEDSGILGVENKKVRWLWGREAFAWLQVGLEGICNKHLKKASF